MRAEGVVRPAQVRAGWWPVAVGAAAIVVAAILALGLWLGPVAVLLSGCVLAGFGITYLSGVALSLEERIAFGAVLGAMAVASTSFVVSMVVRDVTVATVLLGWALALGMGAAVAGQDRLSADL